MRRRFAALLAALLVGTGLAALAPSNPASATLPQACAGMGSAIVSPSLFYPVGVPQVITNGLGRQVTVLFHNNHQVASWAFTLGPPGGVCNTPGGNVIASGSLQGYCGHSTGAGTTNTGHLVQWFSLGGFLFLTNGVVGVGHTTPDTLANSSCAQTSLGSAGASNFIVTGAAIFTNCVGPDVLDTPFSKGLTSQFTPLSFSILDPSGLFHVTFHTPHIHWSIHGCVFVPLTNK